MRTSYLLRLFLLSSLLGTLAHCDNATEIAGDLALQAERSAPLATPENCTDRLDNDADGKLDCADADCSAALACKFSCSSDDRFEQNDAQASATRLSGPSELAGYVCDADWYAISVGAGCTLRGELRFTHSKGNLELQLRSPSGANLAGSYGRTSSEVVSKTVTSDGVYALHVYGTAGGKGKYRLLVSVTCPTTTPPPAEVCDDALDNDRDGVTDCDDADCASLAVCAPVPPPPPPPPPPAEVCGDDLDNDQDGTTDCDDTDCASLAECDATPPPPPPPPPPPAEVCDDAVDNDADGRADCADTDCAGLVGCTQGALPSQDGWTLELLSADHLRVWKVSGGALAGKVAASAVTVVRANGATLTASAVGFHDFPVDKVEPPWPGTAVMRDELYARLPAKLAEGETVQVTVSLPGTTLRLAARLDANRVSPFLKVNQLGFLPADPGKVAYVAGYMGSLGALPVAVTPFEIVDADTRAVVWTGSSASTPVDGTAFGESVLRLPFGAVTAPGRYRVRVPGVGSSVAFLVDAEAYTVAFRAGLRAFYHHRCGTPIESQYTEYSRPACHTDAAHEGTINAGFSSTALYGGEVAGTSLQATGGWHDASDFGKYIPTAAAAIYEMLRIADLAPDLLLDGFSEIPESANGVPDLLDEIAWELDWFLKVQRADGAAYHKVTGKAWNTDRMPHLDVQDRWAAPVTTHDTARLAATLALGARHLRPYDAARAARYETAARRAWEFLAAHPSAAPSVYDDPSWAGGGEYVDRYGDSDERAWAAVELYRLTGEARYHEAFLAIFPDTFNYWSPPVQVRDWPPLWEDSWRWALWSYATLPATHAKDEAIVTAIRRAWQERVTRLVDEGGRTPYGLSVSPGGAFGYGNANGYWYARDLLLGAVLLGTQSATVTAGLRNLDFLFGANGHGMSYMTGIGTRYTRNIEFSVDHRDTIAEPLPGHPVDGPSNAVFWANNDFASKLYPAQASYPPMQRYFDFPDTIMNEPVIDEMATTLLPLGLLASPAVRARLLP